MYIQYGNKWPKITFASRIWAHALHLQITDYGLQNGRTTDTKYPSILFRLFLVDFGFVVRLLLKLKSFVCRLFSFNEFLHCHLRMFEFFLHIFYDLIRDKNGFFLLDNFYYVFNEIVLIKWLVFNLISFETPWKLETLSFLCRKKQEKCSF